LESSSFASDEPITAIIMEFFIIYSTVKGRMSTSLVV